jgi:3-hydroxyisobutyrate dehydrogenase-like beta-hydroxyacid dehydrogenase
MTVGIIGLGIMGSAYAKNLFAGGEAVIGVDPSPDARNLVRKLGGNVYETTGPWLANCDVVILSLVSAEVLLEVATALAGILNPDQVVVETGTFSLQDKENARTILAGAHITLLDCTVSGTGAQAVSKDIIMMASGPDEALEQANSVLNLIAKKVMNAGAFGAGSKLKFVANHAVALHNVAAAETLNYARAMGLDEQVVYDMLSTGAGQSKMSDLRMPLMMSGNYDPPTASLKMFEKDLEIIGTDIERLGAMAPLFDACVALYDQANEDLPEHFDTASVYEVYSKRRTQR